MDELGEILDQFSETATTTSTFEETETAVNVNVTIHKEREFELTEETKAWEEEHRSEIISEGVEFVSDVILLLRNNMVINKDIFGEITDTNGEKYKLSFTKVS